MKYSFNSGISKFQQGGEMAPEAAPQEEAVPQEAPQQGAPSQQEDPIMQLAQLAVQALQNQDCQAAMTVCQAFIQMIQQSQGGAPEQAAPEGEPVYRAGGKLVGHIKK